MIIKNYPYFTEFTPERDGANGISLSYSSKTGNVNRRRLTSVRITPSGTVLMQTRAGCPFTEYYGDFPLLLEEV